MVSSRARRNSQARRLTEVSLLLLFAAAMILTMPPAPRRDATAVAVASRPAQASLHSDSAGPTQWEKTVVQLLLRHRPNPAPEKEDEEELPEEEDEEEEAAEAAAVVAMATPREGVSQRDPLPTSSSRSGERKKRRIVLGQCRPDHDQRPHPDAYCRAVVQSVFPEAEIVTNWLTGHCDLRAGTPGTNRNSEFSLEEIDIIMNQGHNVRTASL